MEKYGQVPKKFTKDWWNYFWEYYKWHVITVLVISIMAGITVYQLTTNPKYDISVSYIGNSYEYSEEIISSLSEEIASLITDINKDGKTNAEFKILTMSESKMGVENPQYVMAQQTQKIFDIQTGESFVFLFDKKQAQEIVDFEIAEVNFIPKENWTDSDNECVDKYFVKLPDNNILQEAGIVSEDVYIGVRKRRAEETDEASMEKALAAENIAKYLING